MRIFLPGNFGVLVKPRVFSQVRLVVAERKPGLRPTTTGVFPLRLRRQRVAPSLQQPAPAPLLLCQLLAELYRIVPAQIRRRVVVTFLYIVLAAPGRRL